MEFKNLRQGYYWPTMKAAYIEFTRKCDKYQQFTPISKAHPEDLTTLTSLWLFAIWGINLIGQLLKGRGSVQYAVVGVDNFTKWVEIEALTSITLANVKELLYKNIAYHYGVLHTIISDNDK